MAEKRRAKRTRRRLLVRYGDNELTHIAYTADVSPTGLFLVTTDYPSLRSRLHLQVFLQENRFLYFEARVVRHRQVSMELRTVEKGGFAVKFLDASELADEMGFGAPTVAPTPKSAHAEEASAAPAAPKPFSEEPTLRDSAIGRKLQPGHVAPASGPRFHVAYATVAAFRKAFETEIRHGGVFLRTAKHLERDAVGEIEIVLEFASPPVSLVFAARAVHISADTRDPSLSGIGFEFLDGRAVQDALCRYVEG